MDKIKVIVNGAKGKMGMEVIKAVSSREDMTMVAAVDIGDDLTKTIKETKADVVVDFTIPSVVMKNIKTAAEAGAHVVVGTTGISPSDLKELGALCEKTKVNIFVAPNFAIGAVLMMQFSKEAVKYMPKAEIIELHHDQKLDAPSGTAKKTAEMLKEVTGKDVPIHSVRLPGFVANQEVIFGGLGQTLTIKHDTISRESFMPGVVLAIQKIKSLKGLVYGLEHIL